MNRPIEDLDLTIRSYACLKRAGIDHEDDIRKMSYQQITSVRNIGRKSVEELEEKLGIEFKLQEAGEN